jgi:hypothetical protein
MAQTTDTLPLGCGKLEIQPLCTGSWFDISGSSTSMDAPTQDALNGETYTLEGDFALVEGGKKQPMDFTFTIVYTETSDEAWDRIEQAWRATGCNRKLCVRWSPGGGDVGDLVYTTVNSIMTQVVLPNMDATSGGVIMAGFTVRGANFTRDTVTS